MSLTRLLRPLLTRRIGAIERYATGAEEIQRKVLAQLLRKAADTEWGRQYKYDSLRNYEQFAATVPVNTYEELKGSIDRMRHGERDILWPGRVRWYAKSSGTTNDKSKFIPVSPQGLQDTHYAGGADALALYLRNTPDARLLDGRALILGGSHAPNYNLPHSLVGDLSAILIENINPLVNLIRVPPKPVALLADFEEKRDRIAEIALHKNVTNLSGVPSWMMAVINRVLEISGKKYLDEVCLFNHIRTLDNQPVPADTPVVDKKYFEEFAAMGIKPCVYFSMNCNPADYKLAYEYGALGFTCDDPYTCGKILDELGARKLK